MEHDAAVISGNFQDALCHKYVKRCETVKKRPSTNF